MLSAPITKKMLLYHVFLQCFIELISTLFSLSYSFTYGPNIVVTRSYLGLFYPVFSCLHGYVLVTKQSCGERYLSVPYLFEKKDVIQMFCVFLSVGVKN